MFKSILTYLQFGNRYCGIEHTALDSENSIVSTVLKKTKNEVDVDVFLESSSVEDLSKQLQKKQHAYLIVNDNQVLSKTIESDQTDPVKLVNKAFANINIKEFYFEIASEKNTHFIAITRKTHVDTLIEDYKSKGIQIIDFSLGNSVFSNVSEFIKGEDVTTSNANILLENGHLKSIEKNNISKKNTYDVNGLGVDNQLLLSLSAALSYILEKKQSKINFEAQRYALLDDYKQSRFFSQFSKAGLIFILGLLLVNFFIFNNYFNKVNTLQTTSQINQTTKTKALTLNERVIKVEKMVNDMLEGSSSKSAFYINDIIQSLPNSVLLNELNYQPLLKRIKKDQPIEIDKATLLVSGTSNDSEAFSQWLARLERYSWVNRTDIVVYGSETGRTSDFSIKIAIDDQ